MLLGDLMTRLQSENDAALAYETLGDIVLMAEVTAMGEKFGESAGVYVAGAAGRFASAASDEEWLSLVATIEREGEPSGAALAKMLRWSLDRDAKELSGGDMAESAAKASGRCGCGGAGGGCHAPA
jgi:hypothetical protein